MVNHVLINGLFGRLFRFLRFKTERLTESRAFFFLIGYVRESGVYVRKMGFVCGRVDFMCGRWDLCAENKVCVRSDNNMCISIKFCHTPDPKAEADVFRQAKNSNPLRKLSRPRKLFPFKSFQC